MGWDQASCTGVCCQGSIRGGQGLPGNDNQIVWLLTMLGEDIKKPEEGGKKKSGTMPSNLEKHTHFK